MPLGRQAILVALVTILALAVLVERMYTERAQVLLMLVEGEVGMILRLVLLVLAALVVVVQAAIILPERLVQLILAAAEVVDCMGRLVDQES